MRRGWDEFAAHQRSIASSGGSDSASNTVRLDALVCNAGALDNELTVSKEGVEVTLATHLLYGTYLLGKLAMPTLQATPESRLIAVSSGGMYNTRFPKWETVACTGSGKYNGQLAYAYCKRGQVLLCERWAKEFPSVPVVSCHPGWVDTAGVQAAYGESKKWLAPLRSLWEGVEGIIWLAVAPAGELRSGEFYLDRAPCIKHLSGPFFSEGSFTKNSPEQVDEMLRQLELWSDKATRPVIEPRSCN